MNSDFHEAFINSLLDATPTNLTWAEEELGLWKGWTYSPDKNRYYFDDIGDPSISNLWNSDFLAQADEKL